MSDLLLELCLQRKKGEFGSRVAENPVLSSHEDDRQSLQPTPLAIIGGEDANRIRVGSVIVAGNRAITEKELFVPGFCCSSGQVRIRSKPTRSEAQSAEICDVSIVLAAFD